jgi:hypothetical protein
MTTEQLEVMQRAVDARRLELKHARDVMCASERDEALVLSITLTWKRQERELDAAWSETRRLIWTDARQQGATHSAQETP